MDKLENLKSKYRATVSEGRRRYAVPKRISVTVIAQGKDIEN
jgi:hypothetical protein